MRATHCLGQRREALEEAGKQVELLLWLPAEMGCVCILLRYKLQESKNTWSMAADDEIGSYVIVH